MKSRVLIVTLQLPILFVAGVVWRDVLHSPVASGLVFGAVAAVSCAHYRWAVSLASWQRQAGRIEGFRDFVHLQAIAEEARHDGA